VRPLPSLRALAIALAAGCGASAAEAPPPAASSSQTYAQAIQIICDVDRLAGLSDDQDPLAIGQKRTEWLSGRIDNPDGIYFRTVLSVKGPEDQATTLRQEAQQVGLPGCALADSIEQRAAGGLSP
jgi:hypothetical protein